MPKSSIKPTTAGNLESKFDAGEDILDYFDIKTAKKVTGPIRRSEISAEQPSRGQLKRAIRLFQKIEKLGSELSSLLEEERAWFKATKSASSDKGRKTLGKKKHAKPVSV